MCLRELRKWWDTLQEVGELYGYYTNCGKTILLVDDSLLDLAHEVFRGTGVQIATNCKGVRYLGSAVGDRDFSRSFLDQKVEEWLEELKVLAKFAQMEPHAAFTALTHGLRGRYTYLRRTMSDTEASVKRIDDFFERELLPALSYKKYFTSNDMCLLHLPARLGGLGLPPRAEAATFELRASMKMTGAQVDEILLKNTPHPVESVEKVHVAVDHARNLAKQERRKSAKDKLEELKQKPGVDKRQLKLLSTKGASAWLTTLPLKRHGCWLSKRDFQDALALRYNWSLDDASPVHLRIFILARPRTYLPIWRIPDHST